MKTKEKNKKIINLNNFKIEQILHEESYHGAKYAILINAVLSRPI